MESNTAGVQRQNIESVEKPQFVPWDTHIDSRGVYVDYKPELMELRERGFGELKGNKLHFAPY